MQCGGLIVNTTMYVVTVTVTTTTTTVTAPINAALGSITNTSIAPAAPFADGGLPGASATPVTGPVTVTTPLPTAALAPATGASSVGKALRVHGTVRSSHRKAAHVRRVVRIRVRIGRTATRRMPIR
jgi:hypothetical protein